MTLSNEFIEQGKSLAGGWSRDQLACLGIPWPPPKGWKKEAIGRVIPDTDAERFLALRRPGL